MKRCQKCLMPANLSGSDFDESGICSWCRSDYPPYEVKGESVLAAKFKGLGAHGGAADCLVGLSGGKDSTYALYRLVKHYGLRAEAFIYTHGGSNDFSLRNAQTTCEKLDVPLHEVSLPKDKHKQAFLRYFRAWLAHPNPTSAGMTCVACKHLHILGSQIATKRGIPYVVWSSTPLEYSPFLAIKHTGDKKNPFKRAGMLSSAMQMGKEVISSPKFARSVLADPHTSIFGCLAVFPGSAFLRYRFPQVKPLMFYSYEEWNPQLILDTIRAELDWQLPGEIKEDWHTDCVFNVFKEYMFQKMFGASYTDAHLSNQIRKGYLTREEARQKLLESKQYYAAALLPALKFLDAEELMAQVDVDCFEVEE
ncbi:MAG TPA: hypothetical protein GX398_01320 [Candidatus Cloacimonetes bacterium]|nr:hypothetical protein [Candidatus Cloacimonadota bacterium]